MVQVPNQLVGAPTGTNVTLVCLVEASPKAINYWTRESGKIQLTVSTVVSFYHPLFRKIIPTIVKQSFDEIIPRRKQHAALNRVHNRCLMKRGSIHSKFFISYMNKKQIFHASEKRERIIRFWMLVFFYIQCIV